MSAESLPPDVIKLQGARSDGPTLAIFAGIHGDERAGVDAMKQLLPQLALTRGTLYVVFANPPAIAQNTRQLAKNLNRCFFAGNDGATYEDQRARELMKLLDECEALLDLHAFDDTSGEPFTICEDNAFDLVTKLEPPIISTNWTYAEPGGTDAYMYLSGKIGICVECGYIKQSDKYIGLATTVVHQFLHYYEMIAPTVAFSKAPKRHIRADRSLMRTSEDFHLDPKLHSFDPLVPGSVYGSQDGQDFVAGRGECIIFPHPQAPLGTEAFVIGNELPLDFTSKPKPKS